MVNTNLVSIKINNIPLQVPEGTRILDACRDNCLKRIPFPCCLHCGKKIKPRFVPGGSVTARHC